MSEVTACSKGHEGEEEIVEYNSLWDTLYIVKLWQPVFTVMLRLMKIRHRQIHDSEFCVLKYLFPQYVETSNACLFYNAKQILTQ